MKTTEEFTKEYLEYLTSRGKSRSTIKNTITTLNVLKKYRYLKEVSIDEVEKMIKGMQDKGNKGQTINFKMERLCQIYNYAINKQYVNINPFDDYTRVNNDDARYRRALTIGEVRKLLGASKGEYRCRWTVHLYTGLRASNVANLRWSWIDFDNNTISIPASEYKTKSNVIFPLHKRLRCELEKHREGNDSELVFLKKSLNAIRKMLRRDCDRAGIDLHGIDLHALRYTFASSLLYGGTKIEVISALLGHKNISTTQKYLNYDKTTLEEGIASLPY